MGKIGGYCPMVTSIVPPVKHSCDAPFVTSATIEHFPYQTLAIIKPEIRLPSALQA
ncbi:hypothetical protein [Taibaiella soli]|uniref:hypothetical protein n=1 Tax=Taibaiella soli TaxID=1649169 RepID=UPI0014028F2C|nr:hypothetical protein [Taibaiella soli]